MTAPVFGYYSSDQGITDKKVQRYNLYYELKADRVLTSVAEPTPEGYDVKTELKNVYTGKTESAQRWEVAPADATLKDVRALIEAAPPLVKAVCDRYASAEDTRRKAEEQGWHRLYVPRSWCYANQTSYQSRADAEDCRLAAGSPLKQPPADRTCSSS